VQGGDLGGWHSQIVLERGREAGQHPGFPGLLSTSSGSDKSDTTGANSLDKQVEKMPISHIMSSKVLGFHLMNHEHAV
jgi:hypothetical protein